MKDHARSISETTNVVMTEKASTQLQTVALELRELAAIAYGDPPSVKVTAGKLFKYAETLEWIASKLKPKPALKPYAGKAYEREL